MDFFAAQAHARRNSARMVGLFALAVCAIVLLVYLAAVATLYYSGDHASLAGGGNVQKSMQWWQPRLLGWVLAIVGGGILLGSLFKIAQLSRGGGAVVAAELGGRLVSRASEDPHERRLLNVVDEMAIAAGIAVPPVYVLDGEAGINAFAAGAQAHSAVVAVTRGALENLSRDELQGVIAHEFSHILNGDMRLNIRLIGVLHGILLLTLAGRLLVEGGARSDSKAMPVIFVGMALLILGWIGSVCGKLIKAGVSREREYLADASAVQLTRNPDGLAQALQRIAQVGSQLHNPRAEEASHMLISTGFDYSALFATHPPLEQRIHRLQRSGARIAASHTPRTAPAATMPTGTAAATAFAPITTATPLSQAAAYTARIGLLDDAAVAASQALLASLPAGTVASAHHPAQAPALLFALLLDRRDDVRTRQLALLEAEYGGVTRADAERHARTLWDAGNQFRLPLLDLALPTLSELAEDPRAHLSVVADRLIEADGRMNTFEYVLRRLLRSSLLPGSEATARGSTSLAQLKLDTAHLLTLLAHAGVHRDPAHRQAAFAAGAAVAPFDSALEMSGEARFGMRELDAVLARLAACQPAFRKKIIDACAHTVLHDEHVSVVEAELLRVVCRALDCPAPPLVRYAHTPSAAAASTSA